MSLHCLIEYLLLDYGMNPDCLKNAMSACDLEIMKAQSESPCHLIQVAIYMQNEKCIFALCNCYHGHDLWRLKHKTIFISLFYCLNHLFHLKDTRKGLPVRAAGFSSWQCENTRHDLSVFKTWYSLWFMHRIF